MVRLPVSPARLTSGALLGWWEAEGEPAQLWPQWPLVGFIGCQ